MKNKNYQYPSTPSISHMFALNFQLEKILNEGLENRFKRHQDMANLVRKWAQEHFQIFTDVNYLSNTLTVVQNTQGINVSNLNKKLQERGFTIANGYGDLKEKTFRISHMGDYTVEDINELLVNIDDILGINPDIMIIIDANKNTPLLITLFIISNFFSKIAYIEK